MDDFISGFKACIDEVSTCLYNLEVYDGFGDNEIFGFLLNQAKYKETIDGKIVETSMLDCLDAALSDWLISKANRLKDEIEE